MYKYTIKDFGTDVDNLVQQIKLSKRKYDGIHGIAQGGTCLAVALGKELNLPLIQTSQYLNLNILIVDDLIDSGETISKYIGFDIAVIGGKSYSPFKSVKYKARIFPDKWIHFWWEPLNVKKEPEKYITRMLEFIGEDPTREGLKETPKRIVKSWDKLYSGYNQSPKDIMKVFKDGACKDIVLLKDIELYSMCEHHMLPFFGKAHIAYIPNGNVIGISKLARLMEIYARRMQIQERIGDQVTQALMDHLNALGAACIIEAQHFCMKARGIEKQNSIMITSSMRGVFMDKSEARSELMQLIKG